MLFRRLVIDGVGPFGGQHAIDLDSLTAGGLFLLEGPTGSGKSSLIDAIVFALYGDPAGAESDYSRIRSSYADIAKPSRVELVFTVSSGTYRVERSPRWDKPKRGGGFTTVSEKAHLLRLSEAAVEEGQWNSGEVLATGAREVGTELSSILGLTRAQFVQTVVLPQGQFADFLRLKSEERSKLLETLFNTRPYREFSQALHRQALDASERIDALRQKLSQAVATWLGNSAVGEWEIEVQQLAESLAEPDDHTLLDFLVRCGTELDKRRSEAEDNLRQQTELLAGAREKLDREKTLAKHLGQRSELIAQQTQLAAQQSVIEDSQQRVDQHYRAVVPIERLSAQHRAETELGKHRAQLLSALTAIEPELAVYNDGEPSNIDALAVELTMHNIHQQTEQSREHLAYLKQIDELSEQVATRAAELSDLENTLTSRTSELATVNERHDQLPQEYTQTERALDDAQTVAQTLTATTQKLEDLTQRMQAFAECAQRENDIRQATEKHSELLEEFHAISTRFHDVNNRWIASQAAILSQELLDDVPCPVCGSVEHPQPAQVSAQHVEKADVDAVATDMDKARGQLEESKTALALLQSQLTAVQDSLGELTEDELLRQQQELTKQKDDAIDAQQRVKELTEKLTALQNEREHNAAALSRLETDITVVEKTIDNERNQQAKDQEKISQALGEAESIAELIADTQQTITELSQAHQVLRDYETALATAQQAQASLDEALAEADMSVEDARNAFVEPAQLESLRNDIRTFESAWAYVTTQLATPEIADLTGNEKVDIPAAESAFREVEESHNQAAQSAALASEGAATASRNATLIRHAWERWAKEVEQSGPLSRLDQLAQAGKASHTNVSLHVWVLMRRFEMVIEHANDYLARFSHGRYELVRSDEAEKERKSGLGLSVIDYDAHGEGESDIRSTRSLSGGETFYTALSLALGLTDVVQQENGGIRIDTLMIDEGFGTLSGEVLDEVMTTLAELARDGRKVGIISHVEELKSRIPNQIRITPTRGQGSTINVIS
ncbi:AAA family ATPase [Arcanobacterium buesumense]|uniref:Nuclease SbcCD subunit C n=1 Tax=Arcanobacterium buesumense TaxID=2722751 RepID=A0A6H2EKC5_9ACTO|nr:SMC family ATPase [Arcanobacterium buesumense]QJC21329.1 SMC family ATPase [Arcanobacterium buesumense]